MCLKCKIRSYMIAHLSFAVPPTVTDPKYNNSIAACDESNVILVRELESPMTSSLVSCTVIVAFINVVIYSSVEAETEEEKIILYGNIYLFALIIPIISILGVLLSIYLKKKKNDQLSKLGIDHQIEIETTKVDWWILGGSLVFVIFTLSVGGFNLPYAQEIVFIGSVSIIFFLMAKLMRELPESMRLTILGTAIIIFVFRAMPGPGPGLTWFEIDNLGFDEQFFSVLSLLASCLTLLGIIILRPFMVNNSIAKIIVILSIAGAILFLPSVGMYYGFHEWTSSLTNDVVDARFIAIFNTALESPLGQVSMIPLLAWIARNAPAHLKATFFAVFASFTNLALSASALLTKYLNQIYEVTREVKDKVTNEILSIADYSDLGILLIVVTLLTLLVPTISVIIIQKTSLKTDE